MIARRSHSLADRQAFLSSVKFDRFRLAGENSMKGLPESKTICNDDVTMLVINL